MRYKAVIFDLDGTLLNTLADISFAMNQVLSQYHIPPHSSETYRYFIGSGLRHLIIKSFPDNFLSEHTINRCIKTFDTVYTDQQDKYTSPYDGIKELLDGLTSKGIPMAILSNKPHTFIHQCVNRSLKEWEFKWVFGLQSGEPAKPDPKTALSISDNMNIPPEAVVFIGDTPVDIQTAKNAGMASGGVTWGFRTVDDLQKETPDYLFSSPAQILSLF